MTHVANFGPFSKVHKKLKIGSRHSQIFFETTAFGLWKSSLARFLGIQVGMGSFHSRVLFRFITTTFMKILGKVKRLKSKEFLKKFPGKSASTKTPEKTPRKVWKKALEKQTGFPEFPQNISWKTIPEKRGPEKSPRE